MRRTILLVEDDRNDALLVKRTLDGEKLPAEIIIIPDGCDAADWLGGRGIYRDRIKYPQADLVILDLRMPRNSGFDVLEFMHSRQDLKKITTIVYTASENSADKGRALTTGANAYLTKGPAGLKDLVVYVKLVIATLPPPKE